MIAELEQLDQFEDIVWPNGCTIQVPTTNELNEHNLLTGKNSYYNKKTGEKIRPRDMLHPETLELFSDWAKQKEHELDWANIPKKFGISQII
jgi:hypothetical protein